MGKTFQDFVSEAKSRIRETTADEVKAKIEAKSGFTLVDVREDEEFAKGRLPGALHLGRGVLERDAPKVLPDPGAEIVLYCGGGSRSALAADTLQQMGYSNIRSLDCGFGGWAKAGLPVEK